MKKYRVVILLCMVFVCHLFNFVYAENAWILKSAGLVSGEDVYHFKVIVTRDSSGDHGFDKVNLEIYKLIDSQTKLHHARDLDIPGYKGTISDIIFFPLENDNMAIAFDIEMKGMDGVILKEVVIADIKGNTKVVAEAKYVDLYQDILPKKK